MPRQPHVSAPVWPTVEPRKGEKWSLNIKVITPMFGGGYQASEVDEVNIIRPAAIRGHLRFWWRATAGAQYKTSKELYQAECDLWGGAGEKGEPAAGKVTIQTTVTKEGDVKSHQDLAPRSTPREGPCEGYLIFPFQKQTGDNPAPEASARLGVEFTLTIVLAPQLSPQQKDGVRRAIQAWLAFGGVGARTRRGCGALQVVGNDAGEWIPPADPADCKTWFQSFVKSDNPNPQWTVLHDATIVIVQSPLDPMQVWRKLGKFWARFRKGHVGKILYSPMSGAKWKDYREELLRFHKNAPDTLRLAKPFLGLPIIYQSFKNAPFSGTIESESSGRMASPVILKPLALANGKFVPMVAVLSAPSPKKIKIKWDDKTYDVTLSPPDKQNDPVMKELQAETTLEAVIVAAEKHIGKEVIKIGGGA